MTDMLSYNSQSSSALLGIGSKRGRAQSNENTNKRRKTLSSFVSTNQDLSTPSISIMQAARSGNLEAIKQLVNSNKGIAKTTILGSADETMGCTALHYAVFYNHIDVVRYLVENGANVNQQNLSGLTPLFWSLDQGLYDIAKVLLEHGADTSIFSKDGYAVLHKAVASNAMEAVKYLVEIGKADINVEASAIHKRTTALHIAAANGYYDLAEYLISNNADVNSKTSQNITPLHKAVARNHQDVVTLLLTKGADINALDTIYRTPLHYAAFYNRLEIASILLLGGADSLALDKINLTPLALAKRKNCSQLVWLLTPSPQDTAGVDELFESLDEALR